MRNYFSNRINRSDGHALKVAPTDGMYRLVVSNQATAIFTGNMWKVEVRVTLLGTPITEKLDPKTEIK